LWNDASKERIPSQNAMFGRYNNQTSTAYTQ
jgi:hypothetical protein